MVAAAFFVTSVVSCTKVLDLAVEASFWPDTSGGGTVITANIAPVVWIADVDAIRVALLVVLIVIASS